MALEHLAAAETSGREVAELLRRDGAVVVHDLIGAGAVTAIREQLEVLLDRRAHGVERFEGTSTKRLGSLVARVPETHPLITHPIVLDAVAGVFTDAAAYQLSATQAVAISPGERTQTLHRDQWAWDHFPFPVGYEVEVSTMWAFTDFTAANGATRVVVGSNHTDGRPRYADDEIEIAEMGAGSAVFYTGSVMHGGGANTTDETRIGMILSYARGWLRQHENQYLCVPVEEARQLPEELQRLIGYSRGAYAIGYWGDMDDPIEAVRPGAGTSGLGGSIAVPQNG